MMAATPATIPTRVRIDRSLWALIAATLAAFWRVRALAGALLLPYLFWVSFAAVLNFAVWRMNPTLLG